MRKTVVAVLALIGIFGLVPASFAAEDIEAHREPGESQIMANAVAMKKNLEAAIKSLNESRKDDALKYAKEARQLTKEILGDDIAQDKEKISALSRAASDAIKAGDNATALKNLNDTLPLSDAVIQGLKE